ncbi:MAG: protein BatD, partial [Desulfobacterales bacterium]|nr:protein BatD [Desulfobacterales bacterium]
MRIKILFLLLLCWAVISVPAYADLSATLDSYQTSLDRPVRLTLVSDQQKAMDKLDLSVLKQNFKIIGQSSSSQISMRNGTVSTEAQLFLDLLPLREGELTVPALSLGGEQTNPLVLKVSAASTGANLLQQDGQAPGLLIETLWENSGKAYVQSQLNLIIRIYHQGNLLEAALDEPRPMDTLVKRIGDDLQGVSSKRGIQYQTIERHYALFPQKSGTLTIPPIAMQARVPASSRQNNQRFGYDPFSRGSQITLSSKPLLKEILPPA